MIYFFDVQRIFLEQKLIFTDIFRTLIHFLQVNVTFYDAFKIIHDVITTPNPFPYAAKFMFVGVRNSTNQTLKDK